MNPILRRLLIGILGFTGLLDLTRLLDLTGLSNLTGLPVVLVSNPSPHTQFIAWSLLTGQLNTSLLLVTWSNSSSTLLEQ